MGLQILLYQGLPGLLLGVDEGVLQGGEGGLVLNRVRVFYNILWNHSES